MKKTNVIPLNKLTTSKVFPTSAMAQLVATNVRLTPGLSTHWKRLIASNFAITYNLEQVLNDLKKEA